MWVLPAEYRRLFPPLLPSEAMNGDTVQDSRENDEGSKHDGGEESERVGDGSQLLEVSARDLARRCLEIVGVELGFGLSP